MFRFSVAYYYHVCYVMLHLVMDTYCKSLLETFIIPIIKDKQGLVRDKDNYRPIAMTNVFLTCWNC